MNPKLILLLLASLVIINSSEGGTGHRQQYADVCNKSRKCDFTKYFRCRQMKCVCYNPPGKEELYYDETARRCVGKHGTDCAQKFYPFDDEDPNMFHMRGATTNHWRYGNGTLRCGANAFCDFDGKDHFCKCRKDYYGAMDGTCMKLKGYGDSCKLDMECDPDSYLLCGDDGTCKCDNVTATRVYDSNLNKCTVQAGVKCETKRNKDDGHIVDDCPQDSFCEENVCRCGFGTQIHSDRTCQRGYGMECGPDHPCGDSKLSCKSKVCQCKYPFHMEYDESLGQCVSLASGICSLNETSEYTIYCTNNAECVQRNTFTECACKPGYLQTEIGTCAKVFGSACESDQECDQYPPLSCINNRCDCQDLLQSFDEKNRKCRGLLGTRCQLNEDYSCIENSKCVHYELDEQGKIGRCICKQGFKGSGNRTCEPVI
ncbi:unnamed protein product [Orchesella dallaii]|uniref:EGF-like domain-containing protein n=1 Tax=Orchesella dallaii TaxID=48710 RepID=A0ABP1Q1H2_9HEXA